jgi:hypothetical protein
MMVDSSHPEVVPNSDVRPMEEEYVSNGHLKSFGTSLSLSLSLSLYEECYINNFYSC